MSEESFDEMLGQSGDKISSKDGKAMILCLDKSGSMSGTPMTALKDGACLLGK